MAGNPETSPAPGGARPEAAALTVTADGSRAGLRERSFELDRDGRRIPGLLWSPEDDGLGLGDTGTDQRRPARPLVLIGHGGSSSKSSSYVRSTAASLVRQHSIAVAAIDGPVHGTRRLDPDAPPGLVLMQFAQLWANDGEAMTDAMVADWRAVLDALGALPELAGGPVGWWGVSLGTIIGLPLVAAEPRISVAVLGLMGLTGPTRARIERDAPSVTCPVLFFLQWHDELFLRADVLALFDALGSGDKRLHAHTGSHAELPDEMFADSVGFLAEHLGRLRHPPES